MSEHPQRNEPPQQTDSEPASSGASSTYRFHFAARSDVGSVREQNEDSGYATSHALAVADGLGGHAGGEVASAIAVGAVATAALVSHASAVAESLHEAVQRANEVIDATESHDAHLSGMGTTLTAVAIAGSALVICHIGDSRGYLFRDNVLIPLTVDHTYVQSLIDAGRLTAEQAQHHPQRSVVLRALGGGPVTADVSVRDIREGDRILLCSDGLSGVVPDALLTRVLGGYDDPTAAVQALVELALLAGAPDNVTVVLGDVVSSPAPSRDGAIVIGAAGELRNQQAMQSEDIRSGLASASGQKTSGAAPKRVETNLRTHLTRWRLPLMFTAGLLVMLTLVRIWIFSQWWVGVDSQHVVVGRGIPQPVLGVNMGKVVSRTSILVSRLPEYERMLLNDSISARSQSDADNIASRLACRTVPVSSECAEPR